MRSRLRLGGACVAVLALLGARHVPSHAQAAQQYRDPGDAAGRPALACPTVIPIFRVTGSPTRGRGSQRPRRRRSGRAAPVRPEGHARGAAGVPAVAEAKIKAMTPVELELSKSSVNCMPRGLPAIWLQNPYSTVIVHTPAMMAQLYEVLNNWRLVYTDGRPGAEGSGNRGFTARAPRIGTATRWSSIPSGSTNARS